MLRAGDPIPEATVWTAVNERATLHELSAEKSFLLVFYLFDWSAT